MGIIFTTLLKKLSVRFANFYKIDMLSKVITKRARTALCKSVLFSDFNTNKLQKLYLSVQDTIPVFHRYIQFPPYLPFSGPAADLLK